jgi:large subunit ribosomal protein L24e
MKRVTEVRESRAEKFWEARMKGKVSRERKADKAQLENELHLVRAPASLRGAAEAEADEAAEEVEAMTEEPEAEAPVAAKARAPRVRAPKLKVAAGDRMRE